MDWLIDLGWKSLLVTVLALLAHIAMRRRPAAERAALLQAALVALLALPLLGPLLPALDLAWLPAREVVSVPVAVAPVTVAAATVTVAPAIDEDSIKIAFYAAVAAALLLRFLAGIWTLRRWTREARPPCDPRWQQAMARGASGFRRPLRLLVSPHAATPCSWGAAPAWILIGPATHDCPEQAEAVIAHELAHIRRFDWIGLVVARLATALFWFNPLAWLVARELAREAELAADAEALGRIDRYDYAQALLAVARGGVGAREANGMAFTRTALARRVAVALDGSARQRVRPLVPALLLLVALGVSGPLAAARIVSAPPVPAAPLPLAPLPPAPEPPAPPAPGQPTAAESSAPQPKAFAAETQQSSASSSSWPGAVRATGKSAGAMLKSLGAGIKATLSTPRAPSSGAARDPRSVTAGAPVVAVSPTAMRIVGRNGAQVLGGPNGISLVGGQPEDEEAADKRQGEEEARKGQIDGLRGSADGLRSSADELERQAGNTATPPDNREWLKSEARKLRAQAAAFDIQARKLAGG